jgi:hypothetical protein
MNSFVINFISIKIVPSLVLFHWQCKSMLKPFLKLKFKKKLLDCENLLLFGETLRAKDPNETRGKPSITRRSNYWKREI